MTSMLVEQHLTLYTGNSIRDGYEQFATPRVGTSQSQLGPSIVSACQGFTENEYMSQQLVQRVVNDELGYNNNETNEKNVNKVFKNVVSKLIGFAKDRNKKVVTFQIGGMDGKTNDPFYKMTEKTIDLKAWIPVVIEPVDMNFQTLKITYENHATSKELGCFFLLNRAISYASLKGVGNVDKKQKKNGMCKFCTFDHDKLECQGKPEWVQYQLGTLTLCNQRLQNPCFKMEPRPCSTIGTALTDIGLSAKDVAVLQLDVEGAEMEILEGYLSEILPSNYPPIIHFEAKILKESLGMDKQTFEMLRSHGYHIRYKSGDADALAILHVDQ